MTKLIIARHGNTFNPGDTPTRVGARTDLPLVTSGLEQAQKINQWLCDQNITPDKAFCSELQRTRQTAEIALDGITQPQEIVTHPIFNEIDYGPDENKPEKDVIARIGQGAIDEWDQQAIVPTGWQFDPTECIENWRHFAAQIEQYHCVFVVTSNGIARFAPYLTGDFDGFAQSHAIKLSTGSLGILEHRNNTWHITTWNLKPA